ncbi:hypothetical protein BDZ45DRAFT_246920 [Acephala macrosclerotiorum]|nr:hypothetical protein BDZ45DRAFT_246920 [Acephala macrosclerotiorum]
MAVLRDIMVVISTTFAQEAPAIFPSWTESYPDYVVVVLANDFVHFLVAVFVDVSIEELDSSFGLIFICGPVFVLSCAGFWVMSCVGGHRASV